MIITVTQEDIDKGKPGMCNCPIARAIKRTTKRRTGVKVTAFETKIGSAWYDNTENMIRFIIAFDFHEFVEPQTFDLLCAK